MYVSPEERHRLAVIGLKGYLQMMLRDNFVHSDLHPGNILVRPVEAHRRPPWEDSVSSLSSSSVSTPPSQVYDNTRYELIFLDVGLTTRLTPIDHLHFRQLFKAIVSGDGVRGAKLMMEHSPGHEELTKEQEDAFVKEMSILFQQITPKQLAHLNVGQFLANVMATVRRHRVSIEPKFSTLVVGTIVLEGLGKQLDPNLNIFGYAQPLLESTFY